MKIISLLISLFSIIKTKALGCVSIVNQKCMPRPKILDVNGGIGEALFYPYNVLVNECSGSCNTLHNRMSKICVPKIVKNVNMQVYNFLMRLDETRNVLWHESCFFFSMLVFFHEHSRITGLQGKGEDISLTPHYHFHPLHRHLDISRAITAESSPLRIASSRTRTGNLWFPSASC